MFVPPFPGSIAKYLSPKSAFHIRHGEIKPFVAMRDGKPVGRIAAVLNRSHNEYYHDRVGFFGFFECEDNPATAAALFRKAEECLREAGRDSMRGPYSPSINDECGLLTVGHHVFPCLGLPWNPPYYQRLLEANGLGSVRRLHGYLLPLSKLEQPARLKKVVDRVTRGARLRLRLMNLKRLESDLEIVRDVYNATLERNWGFVPISMDDLLGAADDIRSIADPKLLLIAEMNGKDAGVAITLPNFNEILVQIKKTPHWLRLPHILWLMKTYKIKSCRQTVLGVVPDCRDRGLHAWLILEQFDRAKENFEYATLGWMEENNTEILKNSEIAGGIRERLWEIFEKPLS